MNRKGSSVNVHPYVDTSIKKCLSSKNIVVSTPEFAEGQENTEFCFGKLNKMANQLTSWDITKQNSKHILGSNGIKSVTRSKDMKIELAKNKTESNARYVGSNSTNSSRIKVY